MRHGYRKGRYVNTAIMDGLKTVRKAQDEIIYTDIIVI